VNWKIAVALKKARESMGLSVEDASEVTGYDAKDLESGVWPDPAVPVAYWRNLMGTEAGLHEAIKAVGDEPPKGFFAKTPRVRRRSNRKVGQCQWDFSDVDWSLSNSKIAVLKKCSPSTVRNYRVKLAPPVVEKRKRGPYKGPKRMSRRTREVIRILESVDWTTSDSVLSQRTGIDQSTIRRRRLEAAARTDPLIALAGLQVACVLEKGYGGKPVPVEIESMVQKSGTTIYFDIRYIRWVYGRIVAGEALPPSGWCLKALRLLVREKLVKPRAGGGWEKA
jgi:hypothetical protein